MEVKERDGYLVAHAFSSNITNELHRRRWSSNFENFQAWSWIVRIGRARAPSHTFLRCVRAVCCCYLFPFYNSTPLAIDSEKSDDDAKLGQAYEKAIVGPNVFSLFTLLTLLHLTNDKTKYDTRRNSQKCP